MAFRTRQMIAALVAVIALLAPASAAADSTLSTFRKVSSGSAVTFTAKVAQPGRCRVVAAQGALRVARSLRAPAGDLNVRVRFAHEGLGRVTVRCASAKLTAKVRVTGRKRSRLRVVVQVVRRSAGEDVTDRADEAPAGAVALPPSVTGARPAAAGPQIDAALEQQAVGLIGRWLASLQQSGQCTGWALQHRPEIFEVFELTQARTQIAAGQTTLRARVWDARFFVQYAQQAGFTVVGHPQPGAVMVNQPGVDGAGASGHVAVVVQVDADGTFTVSEMNGADGVGQVSYRTLQHAPTAGRQFIL